MDATLSQHIVAIPRMDIDSPYTFTAKTLAEALSAMKRAAPAIVKPHTAGCQAVSEKAELLQNVGTKVVPNSANEMVPGQWAATAYIEKCEFHYGFVYIIPRWSNVATLDHVIQAEWRRYMKCLDIHEKGHAQIVMKIVNAYFLAEVKKLRITSVGNTLPQAEAQALLEVRAQVGSLYDQTEGKIDEAKDAYDEKTRHGETQEAVLRTKIEGAGKHRP